MPTFKEIITKCISPKKERYEKIDSILTDIKELEIYKKTKKKLFIDSIEHQNQIRIVLYMMLLTVFITVILN